LIREPPSAGARLPPAAHPGPQAAGRVGDADPAGQPEAPQRLPDARQHARLRGPPPPQVLVGNVVDPPQLLPVVAPQVAELLGGRLGDDGGEGRRAGGRVGARPAPRSLRGAGFAFGTRLNGTGRRSVTVAVIYNVYYFNVDLDSTSGRDEAPPLFLSGSPRRPLLLPGPVPLLFTYFLSGGWGTAAVRDNVAKGHITLLLLLIGRCVLQACDSLASVTGRRNIPERELLTFHSQVMCDAKNRERIRKCPLREVSDVSGSTA